MRRLFSALLIGILWTALLCAVVFAAGDTFVTCENTDIRTLDPAKLHDHQDGTLGWNIYENLLEYDPSDYSIQPLLAESWTLSKDGKSVTFNLRKGVTFHDGTPFNADAVAYSWDRFIAIGDPTAEHMVNIAGYEVMDKYTIRFYVDEPWAFLLDGFASEKTFRVVSPDYVKAHATSEDPWAEEWMVDHTCGTGPYQLERWVRGQYAEAVWHEDYWGGWPDDRTFFKKIVNRNIPEAGTRSLLMKAGDIDYTPAIDPSQFYQFKDDPNIVTALPSGLGSMFVFFNNSKPPLDDPKLREAISYAIDYEACAVCYQEGVRIAQGIFTSTSPGFNPNIPVSAQNMNLAKQLFAAAGYKRGDIKLEIVCISDYQVDASEIIKENLAELGIELTVRLTPWAVYQDQRLNVETMPQMSWMYLLTTFADPLDILYRTFVPNPAFKIGYTNEIVGKLSDLASTVADPEVRQQIYWRLQELVYPDHPALYMWEMAFPFVYRADVKGIVLDTLYISMKVHRLWRE
jgi:peptide/nickel transport system substrate-binding protein